MTNELHADGLTVGPISSNHQTIHVTASAARLAKAFSTSFETNRLSTGRIAYANTEAPLFSASAAPAVQGVIGLDNLSLPRPVGLERTRATKPLLASQQTTGGPQPCPTAVMYATQGAFTANQLASAYNFSSLYGAGDEGAGVTVAVVSFEPNSTSDIAAYQSWLTERTPRLICIAVDGGVGTGIGAGEAAMDIENVIGFARKGDG